MFDDLNSPVSNIQPFYGTRGHISHLWKLLYCCAWVIRHQMGWIHNHNHVNHNQFHIAGLIISHTFQNTVMSKFPANTSRIEKKNRIFPTVYSRCVSHFLRYEQGRYSLPLSVSAWLSLGPPPPLPLLVKMTRGNLKIMVTIYNRRSIQRNLEAFFKHLQIFAKGI